MNEIRKREGKQSRYINLRTFRPPFTICTGKILGTVNVYHQHSQSPLPLSLISQSVHLSISITRVCLEILQSTQGGRSPKIPLRKRGLRRTRPSNEVTRANPRSYLRYPLSGSGKWERWLCDKAHSVTRVGKFTQDNSASLLIPRETWRAPSKGNALMKA